MGGDRRLSLVAGVFALASLATLAGMILSLSSERGIFRARYPLRCYFSDVQGLLPGAPVRLAGKDVGAVRAVRFGPLGGERPPVEVLLEVDREVQARIRSDSIARIGTIGLLGDTYVEVSVGSLDADVLAAGAELPAESPLALNRVVATGTEALDQIAQLAASANEVVGDFRGRMGGERVVDALDAITESVDHVTSIVAEVREGEGLLHSLVYDSYEGSGVESIERSLATLEDILREIQDGRGVLHTLIYDEPEDQDVVMQMLEAGARLNAILEKVDRGDGTVGLLLNDPTVYEDLHVLLSGAQRSLVVRSLIELSRDGE